MATGVSKRDKSARLKSRSRRKRRFFLWFAAGPRRVEDVIDERLDFAQISGLFEACEECFHARQQGARVRYNWQKLYAKNARCALGRGSIAH